MHGGASTGPRTPEGLAHGRRARWKHGGYSVETRRRFDLKTQAVAYESRRANYNVAGPFSMLGSWAKAETVLARERRAQASAARYAERRAILK